jgi:transposase
MNGRRTGYYSNVPQPTMETKAVGVSRRFFRARRATPAVREVNNRMFVEGVLWIVRTGAPWRDLPHCFGNWFSVWKRFRRWALKGVFERVLKELSGEPDFEYALIEGTIVKVHRHGTGAKGGLTIRPSPLARRADDQDCGAGRCARQSRSFCALAGSAP